MIRNAALLTITVLAAPVVASAQPNRMATPTPTGVSAPSATTGTPSPNQTLPPNVAQPTSVMVGDVALAGCTNIVFSSAQRGKIVALTCPLADALAVQQIANQQSVYHKDPNAEQMRILYHSGNDTKEMTLVGAILFDDAPVKGSRPPLFTLRFACRLYSERTLPH